MNSGDRIAFAVKAAAFNPLRLLDTLGKGLRRGAYRETHENLAALGRMTGSDTLRDAGKFFGKKTNDIAAAYGKDQRGPARWIGEVTGRQLVSPLNLPVLLGTGLHMTGPSPEEEYAKTRKFINAYNRH